LGQVPGPLPDLQSASKNNIQKMKNKKNLNPCNQMLFLGSKYAKIAFAAAATPPDSAGGA